MRNSITVLKKWLFGTRSCDIYVLSVEVYKQKTITEKISLMVCYVMKQNQRILRVGQHNAGVPCVFGKRG